MRAATSARSCSGRSRTSATNCSVSRIGTNSTPDGHLEQQSSRGLLCRQHVQKPIPRNLACAEGGHVRGGDLAVDPGGAAVAEMFDEEEQREFRGVGCAMKHRFAGEDAAAVDAVETTDQFRVAPHLYAVRVA